MRTYKALTNVEFGAGRVKLSPEQHKTRAHNLSAPDLDGYCAIVNTIQFKAGEVFGFDGDPGKRYREMLEDQSTDKKKHGVR